MVTKCPAIKRYQVNITISAIFMFYLFSNATTFAVTEIDQFDHSRCQIELIMPLSTEIVNLGGPSTMEVYFEGAIEGSADDDSGNGFDEVPTEIVALNMMGPSSLGMVKMRLYPSIPASGEMEEKVNTIPGVLEVPPFVSGGTWSVDSFFDISFEIEFDGLTFQTEQPIRWISQITHKPPTPNDIYLSSERVELIEADTGDRTGIFFIATKYHPNPIVEIDQFDNSRGQIELQLPDGSDETVNLEGLSTMAVYFEGATEGSANDDDGDDLDEVQAEIVALNLTGSSSFGDVNMHLHPSLSALGEMGETVNTTTGILDITPFSTGGTGTADSFFDIYFEIEVDGTTLRTEEPIRWTSLITHKPPSPVDIYESLEQVELVDDAGHSTGILLTAASYQPSFNIVEIDQFEYSSGQIELQLPDGSSEGASAF